VGEQECKTKPIPARRAGSFLAWEPPACQCAPHTAGQDGLDQVCRWPQSGKLTDGRLCKTKPIRQRQSLTLSGVEERTCERNRRVLSVEKQSQFGALRLLRRYAPRNDMRAVGVRNSGPSGGRRENKNAEQSQFRPSAREWAQTAGPAENEMCKTNPIY
jgi:hypothetical protein